MTADEAIEATELIVKYPQTPIGLHTLKALKLSIEAMKRLRDRRNGFPTPAETLLIGETK